MPIVILDKETIKDKIYACWIGKNIGGTLGGPHEHKHEFLDIKGFETEAGKPLPNDDLDLQLMWLIALEREGPFHFNNATLAEYWTLGIDPNWNEYGTAKANLFDGIMPPLSGELNNDYWKNSNGAWIRSELWACLTPFYPDFARKFAYADATVDHGLNEGTHSELYTVTLQSLAFGNDNLKEIVVKALDAIPENCRVAQSVKLVIDEYEKNTPYQQVREMLIKQNEDMGWFQAPSNIGYVVIGLLYGEGDFKKSMIYTTNCADDADCTAGTVGATLGIAYGTKIFPSDWLEYIGDDIITICINAHYRRIVPKNCLELTERVMKMIPITFKSFGYDFEWGKDTELPENKRKKFDYKNYQDISKWSFELAHLPYCVGYAEFDREPVVKEGEEINISLTLTTTGIRAYNFEVSVYTPDGWECDCIKSFHIATFGDLYKNKWQGKLKVGKTNAINRVLVVCKPSIHAQSVVAEYIIKG